MDWRQIRIAILTGLLVLVLALAYPPRSAADEYLADLVDNYDGDTITFNLRIPIFPVRGLVMRAEEKVRLLGVDTPEIRGKCLEEQMLAEVARDELTGYLSDAYVLKVKVYGLDKYGRLIVSVSVDGVDLSEWVKCEGWRGGWARPYDGGTRQSWCL